MISVDKIFKTFKKNKIELFTGVPDSVLKETKIKFDKMKLNSHFITSNEGSAVALAIGHHLATKKIACVYMQNSGLGNAINPLISIAHKKVYSIPMLLLIGWRGSPGIKDEPQHEVKGSITTKILKLLNIKYGVIKKDKDLKLISKLIKFAKKNNQPVACLIPKNILKSDKRKNKDKTKFIGIKRELAITSVLNLVSKKDKIIATTGFTSRELHQTRKKYDFKRGNDFYMVGGMGHSSMVSLGVAMKTKKNVICMDGDGSFLMHLGSIASIGKSIKKNFKHLLFNNQVHESVGGQSTNIDKVNIKNLILSAGYKNYFKISNKKELKKKIKLFLKSSGPSFLEIKTLPVSIKNLSRPKNLIEIKKKFVKNF